MLLVTGGTGFIGSSLVWRLNEAGETAIVVCDRFGQGGKWQNIAKRGISFALHPDDLFDWLASPGRPELRAVFHMGARSATTETDADFLMRNNVRYSMRLFELCARERVPFIYASSAATYGGGEHGFNDAPDVTASLRPINQYGLSKHIFDRWALAQSATPPFWAGLKFFNVYGPQEYHKGGQASVVYHFFHQIRERRRLRLFKSYREGIAHGEQSRDFVYVKDVVDVMLHLYLNQRSAAPGIYNLGTGQARTFADLGRAVFAAMEAGNPSFEWIDMPDQLKDQYQYYTQADLTRLRREAGFEREMTGLEAGVRDYVQRYLMSSDPYL